MRSQFVFNFNATSLDIWLTQAALVLCLLFLISNLWRWFKHLKFDNRTFDDCANDIRAMNNYNSYLLGAIFVFFGLVAEKGVSVVPVTALIMFLIAFVSAASALFFYPVYKTKKREATPGIRRRWFCVLIPTQWTLILGTTALLDIVLSLLVVRPH